MGRTPHYVVPPKGSADSSTVTHDSQNELSLPAAATVNKAAAVKLSAAAQDLRRPSTCFARPIRMLKLPSCCSIYCWAAVAHELLTPSPRALSC